jgi:hypothetical protein
LKDFKDIALFVAAKVVVLADVYVCPEIRQQMNPHGEHHSKT